MYIVYYGKNNSLAAAISAVLHLRNGSSISTNSSILNNLDNLYMLQHSSLGRLTPMGKDIDKNLIFLLNTATAETIILPALISVFDILQVPQDQLYLADTTEIENLYISVGLYFYSKGLFRQLATKLIYRGILKEGDKISQVVDKTKLFTQKK